MTISVAASLPLLAAGVGLLKAANPTRVRLGVRRRSNSDHVVGVGRRRRDDCDPQHRRVRPSESRSLEVAELSGPRYGRGVTDDSTLPTSRLTPEELAVIDRIADAWRAFSKLDVYHPSDADDFATHVHALGRIVLARAACRAHPERPWIK